MIGEGEWTWHLCKKHRCSLLLVFVIKRFLKQIAIKSHLQASLKLDTLNALLQVSLCGIELENRL